MLDRNQHIVPDDEYEAAARRTPPLSAYEDEQAAARPLHALRASSLAAKPIPAREWLVEDMIPQGTVTMLNGDGGVGKSLLALQLAVAVAMGGYWCGYPVSEGEALFISAEDDHDELHRRLVDVAHGTSYTLEALDKLFVRSLAGEEALLAVADDRHIMKATALFRAVEQRLSEQRPTLLILDTLADLFGGEENNRSQARQFIGLIRGLCTRYGCTVVLLAHPSLSGMASGSGSSGSTAWNNSVRSRLYLDRIRENNEEPDTDIRVLRTKKANYGKAGGEVRLRWVEGMFKLETGPDSLVAIAAQSASDRLFLDLLQRYAAQGRTVSPASGANYAPNVFAKDPSRGSTTKKGFTDAMNRLFAVGRIKVAQVGPPSKTRQCIVAVPTG